jgi:hypothetical protein
MATVAPPLRIGPADHGRMITLEEFREAEELDGYRYELARGVLEVTDVPDDPHGMVVCNITRSMATVSSIQASFSAMAAATNSASGSRA